MPYGLSEIFAEYEKLVADVDRVFERVKGAHPREVKCGVGCCDCCYALFDLTLVEAMYLNAKLHERCTTQDALDRFHERANAADRLTFRFKRELAKKRQEGLPEEELLRLAGEKRIRCSLLNDSYQCDLYEFRPITCRLYGIPLAVGGKGQTCGESGFKPGGQYPTVYLDKIQDRLMQLSLAIVEELAGGDPELSQALVPLSMALLTDYDDEYFGRPDTEAPGQLQGSGGPVEWVIGKGDKE